LRVKYADKNEKGDYVCRLCGFITTQSGVGPHVYLKHNNSNPQQVPWNKGLTAGADVRVSNMRENAMRTYKNNTHKVFRHTKETKEYLSLLKTKRQGGGYRKVPYLDYITKTEEVIKVRGSYEYRFAQYLDSNNVLWEYTKPVRFVDTDGITRHILPDFYEKRKDRYFEVKGFFTQEAKRKYKLAQEQTGMKLHIIFIEDIEKLEKGLLTLDSITEYIAG
jgi:hypothetical protein